MRLFADPEVADRVDRLELPFSRHGVDPWGVTKKDLVRFLSVFAFFYKRYFDVHVTYGTLADAPTLRPTAHIYVGSKAPWFTITDDLPQHEEL